jgi:MGT family glycosyltransferase
VSTRPPAFQSPPLPPTHHSFRAPVFDRSVADAAPAWAVGPLAPPVVYATLGTVFNRMMFALFAPIVEGARDAAGTLIVTVGDTVDPADLGPQPAHVRVERYIPQSLLFPRCDLVVTHGGSGTLLAALAHGLPLVVIPIGADQPANAARVAELGLGRVVGPDERTPEAIRAAVRTVLADPAYRTNAQRMRDAMAALPGVAYAVALLERLAAEKQPMLSSPDRP